MTTTAIREHLTHGWEPATPDADSFTRRFVQHWADQNVAFATAAGGTAVRTERYVLSDYRRPGGWFNSAVLTAPPAGWDDLLDELDPMIGTGSGDVLLWSLWPTPDLGRRGWSLLGHPPMMIRPPARLAPLDPPSTIPTPVRTAAELAVWEDVAVRGYGHPLGKLAGSRPGAFAAPALLANDRLRFWVSEQDGEPVSASAQYVSRGIASLAFGATLPAARGRGHWNGHARTRLLARPELWHAGVFSDASRPLAERLGFVPIIRFTLWSHPRP